MTDAGGRHQGDVASPEDRFPALEGVIVVSLEARPADRVVDWSAFDRADELNDDHAGSFG